MDELDDEIIEKFKSLGYWVGEKQNNSDNFVQLYQPIVIEDKNNYKLISVVSRDEHIIFKVVYAMQNNGVRCIDSITKNATIPIDKNSIWEDSSSDVWE